MTGPLAQVYQILNDWAILLVTAFGTGATMLSGAVWKNHDRSTDNTDRSKANQRLAAENERRSKRTKQQVVGDPDNPNHDSVLELASEHNERLDDIEHTQERILRTVDSIAEELDGTFYRGGEGDD
jgi:hypothetical protein